MGRPHALFLLVEHKAAFIELRVLFEGVDFDQEVLGLKAVLAFFDFLFQELGVDGAFVNIKQGHVVIQDLVQEDDELDQIRIGLLPEWVFAASKQVIEQRGDAEGQGIGVLVIVQRVVAVLAMQADFDVIFAASVFAKKLTDLVGRSHL